ncbi:hypothetical protein ACWC0C_46410 [Streptomyces sp. NPDC001709]
MGRRHLAGPHRRGTVLRPGNAAANTAADHIAVLDAALAQIPDAHRYGTEILIRADSAGSAKAFLAHIRALRSSGVRTSFSVVWSITEPVRRAIRHLPDQVWHPALDSSPIGDLAAVAEVIATYRHRLTLRTSPEAMDSLVAPIGGQQWTPAADVFARVRAASGDR